MNLLCVQQLVAIAIDSFISTEYIELELALTLLKQPDNTTF
jgi:hypothetical protein